MPLSSMEALYPDFRWRDNPSTSMLEVQGRVKAGITVEQAGRQLSALSRPLFEAAAEPGLSAERLKHFLAMKLETREGRTGYSWIVRTYGNALWMLMAATAAVLLIAATNLTNLLMARAAARRQEIAIRLAIGASAWILRRQLLIESALLAIAGAACGVLFSGWLTQALVASISGGDAPVPLDAPLDWRVLSFLCAVLVTIVLIAGWAPAWMAATSNVYRSRWQASGSMRLRGGLIILQTALSFALLGAAGLMISSMRTLTAESTGFDARNSILLTPDLYNAGIDRPSQAAAYRRILAEVRRQPGVVAAGWTLIPPLSGGLMAFSIDVPGHMDLLPGERSVFAHQVSNGYFDAMGIPFRAGRDLPEPEAGRRHVCVISENAARRYFGSASAAVGRVVTPTGERKPLEIVGVVADSKYNHIREPQPPTIYVPYWLEDVKPGMTLAVRHAGTQAAVVASARSVFKKEAGRLPFADIRTIDESRENSVRTEWLLTRLLAAFAAFAILISTTGIAGLLSYAIIQQRREIGIRLALGAAPARIARQVQMRGLVLAAAGILPGAFLAYTMRKLMDSFLFRTAPADPAIWCGVACLLLLSAATAAAIPAWRAARVDPMEALRVE